MKSTIKYIAASVLLTTALFGCREQYIMDFGQGTLHLSTSLSSDVEIVSRALSDDQQAELADKAVIWISNSKGLLHEYNGISEVPAALRLQSGSYTAEAWVGDSVPASWDMTYYRSGFVGFDIVSGATTDLTLTCRVANTLASVSYTQEALEMLSSPVMTISLNDGITDGSHSLVFDETHRDDKGRFMINSRTKGFTWTLTGSQADGSAYTKSGTITDIKPATEYRLSVKFVAHDTEVGGAYFDIDVEEEPVGDESNVEVLLPPNIIGMLGFDNETNVFRGEEGKIGRKSIYISAATKLAEVHLKSSDLKSIVDGESIDLLYLNEMKSPYVQTLHDVGINWAYAVDEETGTSGLRINFEEEFTNTLDERDHTFVVNAIDEDNKNAESTFTISVTNAFAAPSPVNQSELSYTQATLEGTAIKDATEYGFEIRELTPSRAYEDWTRVKATVSGKRIYAVVSDLKPATDYEYRVYADDFVSTETVSFTTLTYPQLPNAGFEDWSTDGDNAALPCAPGAQLFWDTGNHGSQTMSKNVTEKDTSVKHSGNASAMLKSQFVGVGNLGKFAAGNIFVGKYLATDGTDGVLGWGREWPSQATPKALKGYVKYTPGTIADKVFNKSSAPDEVKAELPSGGMDKGIIYIALVDNSKASEYDGSSWPVIIKTKTAELFDKNGSNVKAYGEMIFSDATPGTDMVEFSIDFKEVNPGQFTHIMIVASASKGGDYFLGGEGSTMWLDDLELVY